MRNAAGERRGTLLPINNTSNSESSRSTQWAQMDYASFEIRDLIVHENLCPPSYPEIKTPSKVQINLVEIYVSFL
jgi:hypothetical protein